jgi:hypothetical protein
MKTQRAIATYGVGPHAELLKLSLPTFERFAVLHGYDLHVVPCLCGDRPPAWGKIPALEKLLDRYDEVLWLDADVVIVAPEEDLAVLVPATCLQALVVHINRRKQRTSVAPNTGVWLVRRDMRPYLNRVWAMKQYIDHPWWEQAALIDLMGFSLRGVMSRAPKKANELYARTFLLPAHWNVGKENTALDSHPRMRHALADSATKLRRMRRWLTD